MSNKINNCHGYIWYSDKNTPEVIYNIDYELPGFENDSNPFIVEGQLYGTVEGKKVSYSIKYIDGKYLVQKYDVSQLEKDKIICEPHSYLPNRMEDKGVKTLHFREYWREVEDELCEGMSTLQPAEFVFVGFNLKEDQRCQQQ